MGDIFAASHEQLHRNADRYGRGLRFRSCQRTSARHGGSREQAAARRKHAGGSSLNMAAITDPIDHGHGHEPGLNHQYEDMAQQSETYIVGMWSFLASEVMFFGALFFIY